MATFKRILVPVDFNEPSKHALAVAINVAVQNDATLTLVHAWEIPAYTLAPLGVPPGDIVTPIESAARSLFEGVLAKTKNDLPGAIGLLRHGVPWREILSAIEETSADLVIVGTHGRQGLSRVVLGSVAEMVVRHASVSVLVVRSGTSAG